MDASYDLTKDFDELELRKPNEDGTAPKERLESPKRLRDIHVRLREDDRVNAHNRALCQALLDGEPPYDQAELNDANQPDTTNLNFQGSEQQLERAKAPYYRLLNSGENLVSVRTTYGPEDERAEWESIMDEEISAAIRGCDEFPYEAERLIHKFVWEGVAVAHWKDNEDWRFMASGLGQFFFPRRVAATEARQELVTAEGEMTISELFRKIQGCGDREAKGDGWCRRTVLAAIKKATNNDPTYTDWEKLMEEVKNNDLFVGTRLPVVRVVHGFVKEFDGRVSHYIIPEDDCEDHAFMFRGRGTYASMTEALVLFPYGSGTNTKLHGIRGLGYKIYPFEQQRNRSIGRLIDKGLQASSLVVQAQDETDMANLGLTYFGDLAVLPPGISFPNVPIPDLQRSVVPAIDIMERLRNDRTAGYSQENVFDGDQRKTKAEVMAHLEQSASLSDSAIDFFYNPLDRLFQQVVRRMSRQGYVPMQPGGEEIRELKLRLLKRGVPIEAFHRLDWKRTRVVRVIGAGSAAARTVGLQRMGELRPLMDDVGQQNLNRELAIDAVGVAGADKFFPRDGMFRTTVDTQLAILQNAHLMNGEPIPVLSSDKHLAHAREHLKPMIEAYPMAAEGRITVGEFAQRFIGLFSHTVEHIGMVQGDMAVAGEVAQMRQMLQRIEEFINNGVKELEAMQQEQEAAGEQPQGGPSPEQAAAFGKAQAEIEAMNRKTDAAIANEVRRTEARIAMDDAKAAADIKRKNFTATNTP